MKGRVLVIEDNAVNRELLCDWLESEGWEAVYAEELSAAFRILESSEPSMVLPAIVLLDVQVGAEDGLSLAAWMRQQPRLSRIPVIAVTAHALVTERERFLRAGCNACVSKPIDFKLLKNEIERWPTAVPDERPAP
ncbi:MAG TPA: response regulator [Candidatus Acidoferrum sp.]|nr:response regulator [Candidatus Acidoferrum sp.]